MYKLILQSVTFVIAVVFISEHQVALANSCDNVHAAIHDIESLEKSSLNIPGGDGDLEDALEMAGYEEPGFTKKYWSHPDHPDLVIKTNNVKTRIEGKKAVMELVKQKPTDLVVIPNFYEARPVGFSKTAIIAEKLPIETNSAAVRNTYQSLNKDEASELSYYVLKSKVKDLKYGNVFNNLPNIKGEKSFAFIDTDEGLFSSNDALIEQYTSFKRAFSDEVQADLKDLTTSDLNNINEYSDLLK